VSTTLEPNNVSTVNILYGVRSLKYIQPYIYVNLLTIDVKEFCLDTQVHSI